MDTCFDVSHICVFGCVDLDFIPHGNVVAAILTLVLGDIFKAWGIFGIQNASDAMDVRSQLLTLSFHLLIIIRTTKTVTRNCITRNVTSARILLHPFWKQKYCPSHEHDGTTRCCSCERMESLDSRYLILDDDRKLCLECSEFAIADTHECQPLYLEVQEFYRGLNMEVEEQIPLLLVEAQELNEAMEGEKSGHHYLSATRGLCLSEEQSVSKILRQPRFGNFRIIDMFTEPYRLIRRTEVTVILVLYGLPRLLTGSILAHEMMHAWLRLNGYFNLSPEVEEGICQVLAHMWLESEVTAGGGSSSVASSTSSLSPSKKGEWSKLEKKLGEFFKNQIELDTSTAYGDGLREGRKAVLKYGLKRTLDHIRLTGCFPW